jgi:outer membrane lipoprotein-sorting protein
MKSRLMMALLVVTSFVANAQTADEIIAKYFENTGGMAKWAALKGIKMSAKVNNQGMEIPLEIVQLKDGRQMTVINFQGKEIKQSVYDGTTLWSHNFMTMKAEKSDAESTQNFKANLGSDFPLPFFNYKERGYKVELLGKETVDGSETFKLKLTKNPIMVDGKQEESVEFYYFDTENFVPLMAEAEIKSGQGKGMISQSKMSDYQEVEGVMLPFSMTQGLKGGQSQPLTITSIVINPPVDDKAFAFPEGQ